MSDSVFITLGDAIAWIGVGVIVLAMFVDWAMQKWRRVRGGNSVLRRCPKCWYDLSHTSGLRCSECGHQARRERRLFRARRRWRFAVLGLAMIVGGYALRVTPAVKQRGWVAAVPTTAIIAALPWMDDLCNTTPALRAQRKYTTRQILCAELYNARAKPFQMWRWQRSWLANRCLAGDAMRRPDTAKWRQQYGTILMPLLLSEETYVARGYAPSAWYSTARNAVRVDVSTRRVWPVGVPVYVSVKIHRLVDWNTHAVSFDTASSVARLGSPAVFMPSIFSNPDTEVVCLGTFTDGKSPALRAHISEVTTSGATEIAVNDIGSPFRVAGTIDDCISPVRFEPVDRALRRCLSPQLDLSRTVNGLAAPLSLWNESRVMSSDGSALQGITMAFAIEILCDGDVVGTGRTWYSIEQLRAWALDSYRQDHSFRGLHWDAARVPADLSAVGQHEWTVRLRAAPEAALQNLECDEYWDGEIVMPLDVRNGAGSIFPRGP
jgi:hypothetical protein